MRRKRGILQNGVFVDPARAVAPHPSRLAGLLGYQDRLDQPRATRAGATRRQMLAGAPRGGVGRTQRRAQRRVGLSSVWWPHAATRSVRVGPYLSSISAVPDRPEPLVEWLESSLNEIAGRDPLGLNTISTDRVLPPSCSQGSSSFPSEPGISPSIRRCSRSSPSGGVQRRPRNSIGLSVAASSSCAWRCSCASTATPRARSAARSRRRRGGGSRGDRRGRTCVAR